MRAISTDLRARVLAACDDGDPTGEVADRFSVSPSFVRGLRRTRALAPAPRRHGPAPRWAAHADAIRAAVRAEPDLTLAEYAARLGLPLSVPTLCRALRALGLVRKKSRPTPPSRPART